MPCGKTNHFGKFGINRERMTESSTNIYQGARVLITGATGLVGAHLTTQLLEQYGDQVQRVVCLTRSADPQSLFYASGLDKRVTMAIGDLRDKERMIDIMVKYDINILFHVGAQPIVGTAYHNPYETFASNIMGTVHLLEGARMLPNMRAIVVASSDKAYGKECTDAVETQPLAGDHPYDVSKSATDLIAQTYHNTYGLPITISRFGNIYGPGDQNLNRIIPGIMESLIKNQTLEIRSDGKHVRDYVYVKDVADGYLALAANIDKTKGEAFNFSSDINLSVIDLVNKAGDVLGKPVQTHIANTAKNEIPFQRLNTDKIKRVLNWKSGYSFDAAIKDTYAWYQEYFGM